VIRDESAGRPFDQERPLIVIEERGTAPIDDEPSCERPEGGEDGAATLFPDLDSCQEAPAADRTRRTRKGALLYGAAARLECAQSAFERCAFGFGSTCGTVSVTRHRSQLRLLELSIACLARGARRSLLGFAILREHSIPPGDRRIEISSRVITLERVALRLDARDTRLNLCYLRGPRAFGACDRLATANSALIALQRAELAAGVGKIRIEELESCSSLRIGRGGCGRSNLLHGAHLTLRLGNLRLEAFSVADDRLCLRI
jgi:hypothetical protein